MTKKWQRRDYDSDDFEKVQKIRRKSNLGKHKKSDKDISFELAEQLWPQGAEYFKARVVEVHKRYCFLSTYSGDSHLNTRDVWLGRVARRFLTDARKQRNFLVVGDEVLCRPASENEADSGCELPQCMVVHLAPRSSELARTDPLIADRQHVLAVIWISYS